MHIKPSFDYEQLHKGIVAGVDEVGRGPLAGPVVSAAVILGDVPPDVLAMICDSKALNDTKRRIIVERMGPYVDVSYGVASVFEIDQINILQATFLAMRRAVLGLRHMPHHILVDGNRDPCFSIPTTTLVKGDQLSYSIAAASIFAKVYRDTLMAAWGEICPRYGFERHAGYGTKVHQNGIALEGVMALHRRSFAPVRTAREKETFPE